MADGVLIDPGTDTKICTDDCGAAGHAQVIKLAIATDGNATLIPATAANGLAVGGNTAHDGADGGSPVKVGMKAIAHGANPTAVAANDRTDWYANRAGVPWVIGGHPNVITQAFSTSSAQSDGAIITVSAGTKIVVTRVVFMVSEATTVGVGFHIGFGATTTPTGIAAGVLLTHPGMVPGGWVGSGDGSGILGIGGDGEDVRITSDVPTGGAIRAILSYYTIES